MYDGIKKTLMNMLDLIRFLEKTKPDVETECWEWVGSTVHTKRRQKSSTQGSFRWRGRSTFAHRAAYELFYGPIPNGLHVCHSCDNSVCVNPQHLFLGTPKTNNNDKMFKGRAARKLNQDDIKHIRLDNRKQVEIAKNYRVTQCVISAIKRRASWGWVPD